MPRIENEWERDFHKMSDDLKDCAVQAVTSVLEDQADKVYRYLQQNTPRDTGDLVSGLKKESVRKGSKIGYKVIYDGYNPDGRPRQVIANSLNRGFMLPNFRLVTGTHFQDSAVTLLKGTDEKINAKWEELINERERRK